MSLEQLSQEFKKQIDEVKAIAEEFKGKVDHGEKVSADAKDRADDALSRMNELKLQVEDLEQKAARFGKPSESSEQKSIGHQFVGSTQFADLIGKNNGRGKASFDVKAADVGSALTGSGNGGVLVQPQRLPGILALPETKLTIRDLLIPGNMDGNSLEYIQETGFTNNADMVAEFAKKPQSEIKFGEMSTSAKVIAHYVKASRQILDDASVLASYIDGRLRYGLKLKEESQLLNGDGTGQNLLGIIPQATAFKAPAGIAAGNLMDTLRLAMLQAVLAEFPASGHVLNPIDWAQIETLKDAEGRYIIGNPQGSTASTMWKLPVVETQAITVGKFLTGAFNMGAQIFDRWQARVEVATENEDDFVKNMVTILAEERLALAVYRPESFIYGSLAPASGD